MAGALHHRVDALLARMTLEEQLAQLGSCWMHELQTDGVLDPALMQRYLHQGIGQITRPGGNSTLPPAEIAKATNALQRYLV